MRASANIRIQWFHDELSHASFPNASRLAERFRISRRQAQRDIDYMKKQLGAPMEYNHHRQGYRYTTSFSLPIVMTTENDDMFTRVTDNPFATYAPNASEADHIIIQSQIPYTATLSITDKLTVLEMRSYIISNEGHERYLCEFHNIDRFLCAILMARTGIRIIEPDWLRDKLLHMAEKILTHNT